MIFAKQSSVMSIEGMVAYLLAALIYFAIYMLIQKAKNKELEWRAKRKAQKEKIKLEEKPVTAIATENKETPK